jgi:hypothetical protein
LQLLQKIKPLNYLNPENNVTYITFSPFRLMYLCRRNMNKLIKYKLTIIGVLLGAVAGYLYYYYIGCVDGTCSITSKPLNSTVYGALMGGLVLNLFQKDKSNNKES